ncbi:MAG: glycoside hydrolase family 3 protein, partial [Capsulimonadaceae bacterium]
MRFKRSLAVAAAGVVVLAAAMLVIATRSRVSRPAVYQNPKAPLDTRVADLFSQLTQQEKLHLLTGTGFTTQPVPRLGVPPMGMVDAGQGVRGGTGKTYGPATLFPAEVDMGMTWDTDLLDRIGEAIGVEARNKGEGAGILLGPDVNIHRSPLGGRDAESFAEDPYVMARLASAYIQGMQSTGTLACIKHFACNNEEQDRDTVDVRVDDRALHEIYLPAFEAGVQQAHVAAVMAAYNKINGSYATANSALDTDILRKQWGFDGLLMSDWGAVHETAGVVSAGCDLEMPGGKFLTVSQLQGALASGSITQPEVDTSVRHILHAVIGSGSLDGVRPNHTLVNEQGHQDLAYQAAIEGIVLLKNDNNTLPLDRSKLHSIAVIGPAATQMVAGASGSAAVSPPFTIEPLDAIRKAAGGVTVQYAPGLVPANPDSPPIPAQYLSPSGAPAAGHGLLAEGVMSAPVASLRRGLLAEGVMSAPVAS